MILDVETVLLDTVRELLESELGLDPAKNQIDIELDDIAPAMTGDIYYAISPAGGQMGKHNKKADRSFNYVYGFRIAVIQRIGNVPRDRRRSVFKGELQSINRRISKLESLIRFNYEITSKVCEVMESKYRIHGMFTRPLVVTSIDQKPKTTTSDLYGSKKHNNNGDPVAAMVRGINFGGADFIGRKT